MTTDTVEGWQVYLTPGKRKAHYFVGGMSLCRRVGFYFAELEKPRTRGTPADCIGCRRLVAKRIDGDG